MGALWGDADWNNAETENPALTKRPSMVYNGWFMDGVLWRNRTRGDERTSMNMRMASVVVAVCAVWAVSACFG